MPQITGDRLLSDLHTLRGFGAHPPGVIRPSLSDADMAARRWLAQRKQDAGLQARIDGIGNVFGHSTASGRALLIGSHSDTQPTGGWLDGAMGVVYAIEVARALAEDENTSHLAVDTVAWIDEESTYLSCLGSRSFCGLVSAHERENARSESGVSLAHALAAAGLDGTPTLAPKDGRYLGYLEAHIEQGPYLEMQKLQVGVVSAIVGSRNFTVSFSGQQNHAGTTPMRLRRDAGRALMTFGHRLNEAFEAAASEKSVWTIGRVAFEPGTSSIIPGRANMHLQFRDPDDACLDALEGVANALVAQMNEEQKVDIVMEAYSPAIRPADMDPEFQRHLAAAAERHTATKWCHMPSAAVHDAMFLAQIMPSAMLFVPSINGISHDFTEDTSEDDIVMGCQVLTDAAAAILSAAAA